MKKLVITLAAACAAVVATANDLAKIKAKIEKERTVRKVDKFCGFDRVVFDFEGHDAWVVCPSGKSRAGMPWTWTMQWADAYVPRTNVPQMLADGYHHVTIDTFRHRMDETGLQVSAAFQKYLVEKLGFAPKAYLIGMSWGGFFSIRYAATYPSNVAKIYLDCPLLTFHGFSPKGTPTETAKRIGPWAENAPADGDWMDDPRMPINIFPPIATAKIPVLLLYGGQDQTLDPNLNSRLFVPRFQKAGGDITVTCRSLYGHHPHGVAESDLTIKNFFERK